MLEERLMFKLLKELKKSGMTLHYLKAYSTDSCYVKIDYGASCSIRISNHKGIEKYKYRFNLMTDIDKSYEKDERKYYCVKDISKLIDDVKKERHNRRRYSDYEYWLEKNKEACYRKCKGFWERCRKF